MVDSARFDVVVIGMGPGGEVAASRLLDAGLRVAVVERELVGGECAYWACIPSKTLLRPPEARAEARGAAGLRTPDLDWPALRAYRDTMVRHLDDTRQVDGYRERGATVLRGTARVVGRDPWRVEAAGQLLTADHVVVATGSAAVRPPIEGLDAAEVWTNREATALTEIPERAVLVGGGAVGVELAYFLAGMGTRVTLAQRGDRLLTREEPRVGELAADLLGRAGVTVRTGTQVRRVRREGAATVVDFDNGTHEPTDVVVLGTGRRPRTDGLGLEEVGVEVGARGLAVDERCRVADGLWAAGDVTGVALFTHVAKYQGRVVADGILGRDRRADYTGVPRVVFAEPEIAAVGLTAEQAAAAGIETVTAEVDLAENLARPWTYETEPRGVLGLVADRRRRTVVGAWAVAPLAGEWIHTAALAVRAGLTVDHLDSGIAQFPTYSEGYALAAERLGL
ncbi:dihydrolipoyl dehydrogenase family protein [Marinitenerispora sediminis]|uniref:Pyridine nucleotide-disulfide oxidoreductase n=1 Tax=Marinitenerispora sediminis TaxID=1931232 RepID=A0A368SZJ8_9ACTN|nr:NAD(P)/FAD-dependent oxidoreductase [Marinitenerispora sediminis]RCV48059.1 pyridine nucleotide-disulfide oxidoreductase [Marinitenerispora sediminis]RCV49146.1 pyridine nucleotide-disulfide oxidoreductase [Marinitenerispora sediminis]RCV51397.1 pyridine nucleotide-disulfide oxidoreductase [Marinitenerispora sediminis]